MILKADKINGWHYFSGFDNILTRRYDSIADVRLENEEMEFKTLYFHKKSPKTPKGSYLLINLFKGDSVVERIVTDMGGYLLNDDGKTIERL